jgi:septum formation protein
LAVKKVENAIKILKDNLPLWIFGADTVVAIEKKIYGKPTDRDDAAKILKELSGRDHEVFTSIALYNGRKNKIDCRTAACTVTFAPLTEAEINWYLNTGEWQGVAGAYRIQGLASNFISKINGSPSTVTGLPLHEFYVMLRDNGYPYGA